MTETLDEVEFEIRTIGPLVLTTPVLRNLGFGKIVNRHCPIGSFFDSSFFVDEEYGSG